MLKHKMQIYAVRIMLTNSAWKTINRVNNLQNQKNVDRFFFILLWKTTALANM